MMGEYRIDRVRFEEEPGIRAVRETVFMAEQGVPEELEWDGLDPEAIHVVARNRNGEVIGTGRLLASGQIGRQIQALPFYARHGFDPEGGIFQDADIPHQAMVCHLDDHEA